MTFDRFRMARWALAVYLFVWIGSLQGLLLVSLVADGSHRAIVSATSNQLRLVLHHHGYQDEHEVHDRASAESNGGIPSDHDLSLANHELPPAGTGAAGTALPLKAVAFASVAWHDESTVTRLRADQADPWPFTLNSALRSHRATVLLI